MNIEQIKAAVDAARDRQSKNIEWHYCMNWSNADTALIALWEMMQPAETPEPFRNCIVRVVDGEMKMVFTEKQEASDATEI